MVKAAVKKLFGKLLSVPFVVESGTNGGWHYRKWSDGRAEAWGWRARESVNCSTAYGSSYYGPVVTQSIPSGIFSGDIYLQITPLDNAGTWIGVNNLTVDYVSWYPYAAKSGTYNVGYSLYAEGAWENVGGVVSRLLNTLRSLTWREVIVW